MKYTTILASAAALQFAAGAALAEATAEEAKQLGTTLTEWGAIKAASSDGAIPAYTGGLTTPPASFKPGSGSRPNPYADEKPLLRIDAKNMAQYEEKLSEGT